MAKRTVPPVGVPVTLRESVWRLLWFDILSMVFVVIGFGMTGSHGTNVVLGWLGIALFGGGALVLTVLLAQGGRRLRLDEQGVWFDNLRSWRMQEVAWRDIAGVRVWRASAYNTMVGFDLVAGAAPKEHPVLGTLSDALGQRDRPGVNLPTVYGGMKPPQLAAYLNQWLAHARSVEPSASKQR